MSDKKIAALDNGEFKQLNDNELLDYEFPGSKDFFSTPTNLIPRLGGVSGGRVLLGDKAALQAISIKDRERPLVESVASNDTASYLERFSKLVGAIHSTVTGTVVQVTQDEITVKGPSGKKHIFELYNHHPLGRKSFIHNTPVVKVGDTIKPKQLLASSNFTDDKGVPALGKNLTAAVMPYRSSNFEDAITITEAGAAKMLGQQMLTVRLEQEHGTIANKDKYISNFPNRFSNQQLTNIASSGVVQKGIKLKYGDPIILAYSPRAVKLLDAKLGKLSKALKNAWNDRAEIWDYEAEGEVVNASIAGKLISVNIRLNRYPTTGSKLSNGYGAKGVVGAILPNSQAPTMANGKPVDIIINSMSITSRVAPALAVAMALGKYAQKKGKPVKMSQFVDGSSVAKAIALLKQEGLKDKEELYDPVTGRKFSALVGPLYTYALTHIAEDKVSSRSQGIAYTQDRQPANIGEESSKRLGNLATTALLAHNAKHVLEDVGTIRSTKNDEYWRAVKLGLPPPSPSVPFIFEKFISQLEGAGVKVDKDGDHFNILPQTDKDILAKSSGSIKDALTFKVNRGELEPEKGGMFDPDLVGIHGNKFNHIDLHFKVPNPISEDPLRKLLGASKVKFEEMIKNGSLEGKLAALDVDTEIARLKNYIKSGKRSDRDSAVKVYSFLLTLKKHNLKPKDLMLSKVPVIPAQYRPISAQGDMVLSADVNTLYKDLMLNNEALQDSKELPEELLHKLRKDQYAGVKAVYGLGDPISLKSKEKSMKGLLGTVLGVQGGSAKGSMFQSRVVNKPVDLVGRAVLAPDASLGLDEAYIPKAIAWKVFKPFVIRELVRRGIPSVKAAEMAASEAPLAQQALGEVMKDRPGIISRDPALHKFNLTGFMLKLNPDPKDTTVKMSPLVFKSFGADSDGDQLNISIPASHAAKEEVKEKMLPSKNLLHPSRFNPVYVPSNEAALGLFQCSTEDLKNSPKKFKTEAEVISAFRKGELAIGDRVEVG